LVTKVRVADLRYNILEDVPFGNNHTTSSIIEGMARVGIPVVVDGMEQGVATDLGAAARGVVNIVTLHCDQIVGSGQVHGPVVMAIAGRGPACRAIEFVVGECHSVGGSIAGNEHLAANERHFDVVCGLISYTE
jgi:hypothetical protein